MKPNNLRICYKLFTLKTFLPRVDVGGNDVLKPQRSSSGHPFTWISQPGCGKYGFYTEFPNQHLKVKTKKWKYEPVEVGFFNIQVTWFFVTTRNLI